MKIISVARKINKLKTIVSLAWMRLCLKQRPPQTQGIKRFLGYTMKYIDPKVFYYEFKDIFIEKVYHFYSEKVSPFILDCGSHIGMSILYFKRIYPEAKIIGFEPDPVSFKVLKKNIERNHLNNVQLINAALSATPGTLEFLSDGMDGSHLARLKHKTLSEKIKKCMVKSVRLVDYITESIDFLKIDIEGAEYEVLLDISAKLPLVKQVVIEYHTFEGMEPNLPKILDLLTQNGFKYFIYHSNAKSPFWLKANVRYCLLIYAYKS